MKKNLITLSMIMAFGMSMVINSASVVHKKGEFELDLIRRHMSLDRTKEFIQTIFSSSATPFLWNDRVLHGPLFTTLLMMQGLNTKNIEEMRNTMLSFFNTQNEWFQKQNRFLATTGIDQTKTLTSEQRNLYKQFLAAKKKSLGKITESVAKEIQPILNTLYYKLYHQANLELTGTAGWNQKNLFKPRI